MLTRKLLSLALGLATLTAFVIPSAAVAKDIERTRISLVNTGTDADASGKAEYRLRKRKRNRISFKLEAEDLDAANYDVTVGGVVQGVLDVRALANGRVEGEIEFDTKVERGHELLDFEPRGQLVTVERAGVIYLQVVFPVGTSTGGGTCPQ